MNKWEILSDDHKTYDAKQKDMDTLLNSLEEKFSILQTATSSDINEKTQKLKSIVTERDQASSLFTDYLTYGESLLPDTATSGRENIRREMKEIRER